MTPKVVCILGMHRSGTSMVTRLLNICGVYLGEKDELLGPFPGNEKGLWEHREIMTINIEILERFGGSWDNPPKFPENWINCPGLLDLWERATKLVQEMGQRSEVWGFKDPRVCLTHAFWEKMLPDMIYIIPVRDPLEVAFSLKARDGMSIEKGLFLYKYYLIQILKTTDNKEKIFTLNENFFKDWRTEVEKLTHFVNVPEINIRGKENEIQAFIDPDLYHQKSSIKDRFEGLKDDQIFYLLKYANQITTKLYKEIAQKNQEIEDLTKSLNNKNQEIEDLIKSPDNLNQEIEALIKTLDNKNWEIEKLTQNIDIKNQEIETFVKGLDGKNREIETLTKSLDGKNREIETLTKSLDGKNREIETLDRNLNFKNREIDFITSSKFWKLRNFYCEIKYESTAWKIWNFLQTSFQKISKPHLVASVLFAIERHGGLKKSIQEAIQLYRHDGMFGITQGIRRISARYQGTESHYSPAQLSQLGSISKPADELLELRILIVAELSLPQCTKYRVIQKQAMFEKLNIGCSVISWTDSIACYNAVATHSLIIFYRVPGFENVLDLIAEARRLKIPTIWEVDDLIFDRKLLKQSKSLAALDKTVFDEILNGANLYLKAMLACDKGIASTIGLSHAMKNFGLIEVDVIENGLDLDTLDCAKKIEATKRISSDGIVRIVYGSGTNTHNVDFKEVVGAILHIFQNFDNVKLRLIGPVELPEEFAQYESKLEKIPFCDYRKYLSLLSECDISIAPLEKTIFNDAKSNIKFLEASIVAVPSVCSSRKSFKETITHGENGFLCKTQADFIEALEMLISDSAKRRQIGESAYKYVMTNYSPDNIMYRQVLPLIKKHSRRKHCLRVLSVNVYYSPRSFGGATLVAEEVNRILNEMENIEIYVFTTLSENMAPAYQVRRWETEDGTCVFGMGLPGSIDERTQFENPHTLHAFKNVLSAVQPDLVHLHCIQGIGCSITDLCQDKGIRYIVTLHDTWWLCGRHFMINRQGKYCGQEVIDKQICASCVDNPGLNNYRQDRLRSVLNDASLLLLPSQFFADFYIHNDFSSDKVLVNKNGIRKPAQKQKYRRKGRLTFAYAGGNTEIKGVHLVKKVFADLVNLNIKLVVVDNTINLGFSSFPEGFFTGCVEIVPAYTQKNLDDFFSKIDILLFPTQLKESFGLTVREAIARNIWVIATDAGGVAEDIIPGKNGFIIPLHDGGEALKQAVINTFEYFKSYQVGDEVCLKKGNIQWFEGQAHELADIYNNVIKY